MSGMNQELFDLINEQTGKVLVQSELNDIINLVLRLHTQRDAVKLTPEQVSEFEYFKPGEVVRIDYKPQQDVQGVVDALNSALTIIEHGGNEILNDMVVAHIKKALKSYQEGGL